MSNMKKLNATKEDLNYIRRNPFNRDIDTVSYKDVCGNELIVMRKANTLGGILVINSTKNHYNVGEYSRSIQEYILNHFEMYSAYIENHYLALKPCINDINLIINKMADEKRELNKFVY